MPNASLIRRSLWHYRRSHTAVALGVAVATAVLVGALVVGDSVRGSLRALTLERLGRITHAVAPGRPFRAELASEVAQRLGDGKAEPIFTLRATLSHRAEGQTRRASGATLIGCRRDFWSLGDSPIKPEEFSAASGALLTVELANELGVKAGEDLVVRVATADPLPADSPLGEKSDTTASVRVRVDQVIQARGLARFGLRPSQQTPRNIFLPIERVQDLLGLSGQANVVLIASDELPEAKPSLEDYGLSLEKIRPGVWQLESEALVLTAEIVDAAREAFDEARLNSVVTYLANTIRIDKQSIPYSTGAGVDWLQIGSESELAEGEINEIQPFYLFLR